MGRRRSGKKYAPRLCRQIADYIGWDDEGKSTRQIYAHLVSRTKMTPTRNQLSNILGRTPFFIAIGKTRYHNTTGGRGEVTVWVLDPNEVAEERLVPLPLHLKHLERNRD